MGEQETENKQSSETFSSGKKQPSNIVIVLGVLLAATVLVLFFNSLQQAQINSMLSLGGNSQVTGTLDMSGWTADEKMNYEMHGIIPARLGSAAQPSGNTTANFSSVSPTGVPAVYGAELGIRYDDVSTANPQKADSTIAVLSAFDQEKSSTRIELTGNDLQRFITIGSMIACEYCCGATTLVFSDGTAACGCAHSYAMRGLARYLISKHGSEFTDDQILEELGKWKTLFFPSVLAQKAAVMKQKGIEFNYINLASNKYRGLEKETSSSGSGSSMVGGC
ncbi:MAG TPA: hypothetical protein VI977_01155 [archaeon]|nr:hypothetical protein [archaeon]